MRQRVNSPLRCSRYSSNIRRDGIAHNDDSFKHLFYHIPVDVREDGVDGMSSASLSVDTKNVDASSKPEPALFSPVYTPRVSNEPVRLAPFFSKPSDFYVVVRGFVACIVMEYTVGVCLKAPWTTYCTRDRAPGNDFGHHVFGTVNLPVFYNGVESELRFALPGAQFRHTFIGVHSLPSPTAS